MEPQLPVFVPPVDAKTRARRAQQAEIEEKREAERHATNLSADFPLAKGGQVRSHQILYFVPPNLLFVTPEACVVPLFYNIKTVTS
jgi:hypothetical protein